MPGHRRALSDAHQVEGPYTQSTFFKCWDTLLNHSNTAEFGPYHSSFCLVLILFSLVPHRNEPRLHECVPTNVFVVFSGSLPVPSSPVISPPLPHPPPLPHYPRPPAWPCTIAREGVPTRGQVGGLGGLSVCQFDEQLCRTPINFNGSCQRATGLPGRYDTHGAPHGIHRDAGGLFEFLTSLTTPLFPLLHLSFIPPSS